MAQKRKSDQTKLIADAALSLAGKTGWDRLTFKDIARKAKVSVRDVEAQFSDTWEILKWVLKRLETDTRDGVERHLGRDWRDNLAEILMTRFELAQEHRAAFASLGKSFARHPEVAHRFVRGFYTMLDGTLRLSGVSKKFCQPVCVASLGVVYLSLVDVWMKDNTPDLSKTMAAIDRRLDLYAQVTDFLNAGGVKKATG
jgi:AcrR family transcriptional regulator